MRPLWQIVELVFEVDINFKRILGLDEQFEHDDIITIVFFSYLQRLAVAIFTEQRSKFGNYFKLFQS